MLGICGLAHVASAEPSGAALLARGIRAFETRDFAGAVKLFEGALARGKLSRAQTLTAYVDLGTTLAALKKSKEAAEAFEQAALLDPDFVVPPHSGKQAATLAYDAKKKLEAVGQFRVDVQLPDEVVEGQPFAVAIDLVAAQVVHVALVRVTIGDATGKKFDTIEASAVHVDAKIPGDATTGADAITVRAELLDVHENRLATIDHDLPVTAAAHVDEPKPDEPGATPDKPSKPDKSKPDKPGGKHDGDDDGDDATSDDTGAWSIPHGSKKYVATRAERAPKIDGVLDDAIWKTAPPDDRFLSTRSKPFGKPTTEPTSVQVAYDDKNLYVAFRCRYSKPREPSGDYASDEQELFDQSEYVAVIVDAVHGHAGGYEFAVSPAGVLADAELSSQGEAQNLDWHGIWSADTELTADGWTAEIVIPWGTMYMPGTDGKFDIGINFERHEPISGEVSLWALHPPATELYDLNFFGHVDGLERVHPGQRLLLLPYVAAAFDSTPPAMQSQLTDFTGTNAQGRVYAGAYVRLRPPGPFRLDATINPDFSAISPDRAAANFDRFELEYPELRPFFAEDALRFSFGGTRYRFGDLGEQLFYSRRLGISTDASGFTSIVPILWGVKSVVRAAGFEAAIMNVETVQPTSAFALGDNATIARVTETFSGQRIGAIVLACGACGVVPGAAPGTPTQESYLAAGGDVQLSMLERHLIVSGFGAATKSGDAVSGVGEGTVSWRSQDFYGKGSLLDSGKDFQAPLGFFETTGVRAETIAAGYTPVIRRDHVQQIFIEGQLSNVTDRESDALVYRRAVVSGSLQTYETAELSVAVMPSTEVVATPFPIGNGRITVPTGSYNVIATNIQLLSPPGRTFVFGLNYLGGDLFEGSRHAPGAMIGLNLGRFTARAIYSLYILKFADLGQSFLGHDASVSASYAYSPRARTSIVLQLDTVAARASALATTSIQFGTLSAITLSVRGASGSTFNTPAMNTFDNGTLSAILSIQIGASPF